MQVKLVNIDEVEPYEGNPRQNDQAVDAVAASLREFGFRQPIVVDEAGVIIVGHTRWKAAKKLGLTKVPVHVARDLSPEQAKAYRVADNQSNTLAEWNYELLPIELKDLRDAEFNLDLLGFDAEALAKMLDPGVQDGQCDPDEVPAPPDEATTRPGDLYLLGDHRLLCGDSGEAEDVDRLLDGAPVHLVNTDPPYNVKVAPRSGNAMVTAQAKKKYTGQQGMDAKLRGQAHATTDKLRPKDRPLANDFVSDEEFAPEANPLLTCSPRLSVGSRALLAATRSGERLRLEFSPPKRHNPLAVGRKWTPTRTSPSRWRTRRLRGRSTSMPR